MRLTPQQFTQIQEALLDAYTLPTLEIMVKTELGEDLPSISEGENQRVVVFNLVSWAERTDHVVDLVRAAYHNNKSNAMVQKLGEDIKAWFGDQQQAIRGNGRIRLISPTSIDIFLTYSRKNAGQMHTVLETLRDAGFSVWTDEGLEPGTSNWRAAIEEAIRQASVMVALLSPDACSSEWVGNEVAYALTKGKDVVPVLIAGDPSSTVPISLINRQWIDGRERLGEVVCRKVVPVLDTYIARPIPGPSKPSQTQESVVLRQLTSILLGSLAGILAYWIVIYFLCPTMECDHAYSILGIALSAAGLVGIAVYFFALARRH